MQDLCPSPSLVCILGGSGFIGSHIAEEFLQFGSRVRILSRRSRSIPSLAKYGDSIELVSGDITSPSDVLRALDGASLAIHCVSATLPADSNSRPEYDVQSNLIPALSWIRQSGALRLDRLMFISSGGTVYGKAKERRPQTEEDATSPLCSYGIVKLAIEKYVELYAQQGGPQYTNVRLANAYGERQFGGGGQGAVANFLSRMKVGLPIEIWGDGDVVRDYIYVKDAARAVRLLAQSNVPSGTFNLGTGVGTSLLELVASIERATGLPASLERKPARPVDVPYSVLDSSKLTRATGWRPEFAMEEALSRTWSWWHAEGGRMG